MHPILADRSTGTCGDAKQLEELGIAVIAKKRKRQKTKNKVKLYKVKRCGKTKEKVVPHLLLLCVRKRAATLPKHAGEKLSELSN